MQVRDPNFFYAVNLDEECRIKNIFWADARCRATYESFCYVISFDTTCLTQSCDLPLVSFIGMYHHGQTVLLGCGLVSGEDTELLCGYSDLG